MSTINTNNIDSNYPIPGVNNSSQGFRTNFTSIKNNLDIAGNEITDLQNKVVVKQALNNQILNNDMANTLISNASIRSFRHTTYNLGNALVGTILVNTSLGDVQYGTLSGNVTLNFGNWAPSGTQSAVELQLARSNIDTNFTITFSSNAEISPNSGWSLLENSGSNGGLATLTFPYDVTQINLTITSIDCGNTLFVEPTNRPYKTTQVQQRTPAPTGSSGDVLGTVAVDANYFYVCTGSFNSTTINTTAITTTTGANVVTFNTSVPGNVTVNMPVIFDTMLIDNVSVPSFGGINKDQVYYVKTISGANITISDTRIGGVAGPTLALTTVNANTTTSMDATFYNGTNIWKRVELTSW